MNGELVVSTAAKNLSITEITAETAKHVYIKGDLSKLTDQQKMEYVSTLCRLLGLNPLTRPFDFTKFQGMEVLYARKDCSDQLRKLHGVSVYKLEKEIIGEIVTVKAYGRDKYGKEDIATGAVYLGGLKGQDLANAHLKCETKAKRRLTLSICGLGFLDETEVEDTIPTTNTANEIKKTLETEREITEVAPLSEFKIRFGKLAQYETLGKVPASELVAYVSEIEKVVERNKKPLEGAQKDLLEAARAYLVESMTVPMGGKK